MRKLVGIVLLGLGLSLGLVACQQGGSSGVQLGNPDFTVNLSRSSVTLTSGKPQTEILVQVVAKNGFSGPITLSVEGLPEGVQATFDPASVTPQSTVNVVTGVAQATLVLKRLATPEETQTVTAQVKASSGSTVKQAPLALTLTAPTVVLSEDFSEGIPSSWEVIDHTGEGGWTTEDDCDREADYGPLDPIIAPFAIIDSDCLGDVDVDTELRTPVLDLSAYSAVRLRFDHYFYYSEEEKGDVDVSTDGGITWTNVARFSGEDVGPKTETIDISSIAAGQANVRIRFHYYDANYEWFWIVDNVTVEGE